jgi:DNA-binding NtrC family response regulator
VVVASVAQLAEARDLIRAGLEINCALLDLNLADGEVTPLLESLRAGGVPVLVDTGADRVPPRLAERHRDVIVLSKPVLPGRLVTELKRAIRRPVTA